MSKSCLGVVVAVSLCATCQMATAATSVGLQNATATFSQVSYEVSRAINGLKNNGDGWAINPRESQPQTAVFETAMDAGFAGGSVLTFTLSQFFTVSNHTLGRFRLSATTDDRAMFADGLLTSGDVAANWVVLNPTSLLALNRSTLSELGDLSILASGTLPAVDVYTVTAATAMTGITGFRLEMIPDSSLPFGGSGRYGQNGNFVLTEFEVSITAVPEPRSYALMLAGLAMLGFALRGKRPVGRGACTS